MPRNSLTLLRLKVFTPLPKNGATLNFQNIGLKFCGKYRNMFIITQIFLICVAEEEYVEINFSYLNAKQL